MERDRRRVAMTVAIVASLLLGLAGTGLGIAALRNTPGAGSPAPVTSLVTPKSGTTISGIQVLGAVPIGPNVVAVDFLVTGGTLHDTKIAAGTVSLVGFTASWDTRTEANGVYSLVSVSYNSQGQSSRSSNVVVTVQN